MTHTVLLRNMIIHISLIVLWIPATAQGQWDYVEYYDQSRKINNIGMAILGSWALANISVGAYGWYQQSGERSYFHQMNLFWNTINLSIAGIALYRSLFSDYSLLSGDELLEMQYNTQRLYLINGVLDVGYVATGFFLKNLAPRFPKNELRLKGYGNSVILQGSFLFVFDLILYGLQRNHRADFLQHLTFTPMQDAWGLAFSIHF